MNFIDTHAHIYLEQFDNDREEVVLKAKSENIILLLIPDIDSLTRTKMLQICKQFEGYCLPMLGIHPTSVKANYKKELELLKLALEKEKAIAIGECGLDYYWDKTFISEQTEVLIEQFYLAQHYQLPLVIHSRKSLNELISLIKEYKHLNLKGVFHCYPGNINEAIFLIDHGFYLGIGGVVTYKNSTMSKIVKDIPIERILLETDAPYLPPVPYRGQRNESSYVPLIAAKIAELKGISIDEVAEVTTKNAKELFNI